MNFSRDVVDAAPPEQPALIELTREGSRRTWTFREIAQSVARFAGKLENEGVRKGDAVLVWIGNRAEWVIAMTACFRLGVVPASCPEQLRAKDLRVRLDVLSPVLVIADRRNETELRAAEPACPIWWVPDDSLWASGTAAEAVELDAGDPCLVTFTSGTSGEPKAVLHLQRYLVGQKVQARHWYGAAPGDVAWSTASSGWSKSARNAFIAPWLCGATAIVHNARFDPEERLAIIQRENVNVLCMAPTEYRIIAKRTTIPELPQLRSCIAAGEPLDPGTIGAWREAAGVDVRDGYGQTETGQLTGFRPDEPIRPGSMGRALPGMDLRVEAGELVADPATVPTFFGGYLGEEDARRDALWHTGDRVEEDEDGYLWFQGRTDDLIISAGYRIGPFEIEAALGTHPAVVEAAAVSAPDEERGAVVRAVVILRDGYEPSDELKRALQEHVKAETAPYKYPRLIDFVQTLPKTASGKIRRAALRQ